MNKSLLKKIVVLFFVMFILRVFLIAAFNYINVSSSHYIQILDDVAEVDNLSTRNLYTLRSGQDNSGQEKSVKTHSLGKNKTETKTKTETETETNLSPLSQPGKYDSRIIYLRSKKGEEFNLFIDRLAFHHRIYINDVLLGQNVNKDETAYNGDYAYKVFKISSSDYVNNILKLRIEGSHINRVGIFLAKDRLAKDYREVRLLIHIVVLVFLILGTLISLILYNYNRKDYYFLIFSIMGLVSIFKLFILGEIFIFSRFLDIRAFSYLDSLTNIINTILPIFIIYYLFDFKIKARYTVPILLILSLVGIKIVHDDGNAGMYSVLFAGTFTIGNVLMIIAYLKDKSYSMIIILNSVFYSACAAYYLMEYRGSFPTGSMIFFMSTAYLGAIIYMAGFLMAILLKHLDKVRLLETEKKEYERVSLLRGIGHDLKLPLSVIKLNNQMIEKYDLSDDEAKDFARISLEAAKELEQMTENINTYLSLQELKTHDEKTSVKECFGRMAKYYNLYNKFSKYGFSVEIDEKDCILEISPIFFDRMLYNLVDNAFKYNKEGVNVLVSYKVERELVVIIEDDGIGMDKDELNKIFEPFYQVDYSRTAGGMGLGLSVVRQVVDSLNGTIKVTSEKTKGTRITIGIPLS